MFKVNTINKLFLGIVLSLQILFTFSCESKGTVQGQDNISSAVLNNTNVIFNNEVLQDSFDNDKLNRNKLNRQLWEKNNICNYNIILKVQETGLYALIPPVKINVRDNIIEKIESISKDTEVFREKFEPYNKVEKLFDFVESKIKQSDGNLEVLYDSKLGYPKEIQFTPKSNAIDGRLAVSIEKFENLSSQYSCK